MIMSFFLFVFLNVMFFIIFSIYLSLITQHIYKNLNKQFSPYWVDVWLINFLILSFVLFYLFSIIYKKENHKKEEDYSNFKNTLKVLYFILILSGINNLLQNLIKFVFIIQELFIKNIYIRKISDGKLFNKKIHFVIMTIMIVCKIIFIVDYINGDEEIIMDFIKYISITIIAMNFLELFIINYIINKKLENCTQICYEEAQRINLFKIKIYVDFMIHKIIFDVILIIPFVIIFYVKKIEIYFLILNYLIWIVYLYLMGNLNLVIDKNNKITINNKIKSIFLKSFFNFKLGCNSGLNNKITNKIFQNKIKNNEKNNLYISTKENTNFEPFLTLNNSINDEVDSKDLSQIEKDYLPVNFFIIFKLLNSFYKQNEKFYEIYENQISQLSVINKSFEMKLKSQLNFSIDQIFNNLEDIEMNEQFEKIYNLENKKYSKININYKISIESLFTENLLELYPFYQIFCKDIINSLETQKNKIIFKMLFERKYLEKSFNLFFTKDTFLQIEIYDKNVINFIEDFMIHYKSYIKERYSKWRQTFIPLIVGIFNIKYLYYDKIIILSRHPLAFSPFLNFKYWINLALEDFHEKISISSNFTEIIDIKEIEIKDNICLHKNDFQEIFDCLNSDFEFIKKVTMKEKIDPALNIFIINEIKDFLSSYKDNQVEEESKLNSFLNSEMRKTDFFRETVIKQMEKSKRENGSDVTSPLDKLVTNYLLNSRYIIKIYFSGLFNICNPENEKNHQDNWDVEDHNLNLISYLKSQIEKIIKQSECVSESEDFILEM